MTIESRNIFANLPGKLAAEEVLTLFSTPGVEIERIVSTGQASAAGFWFDAPRDEWVILLAGEAGLRFEGEAEVRRLAPGDWVHIPAHTRHRVDWTAPEVATVWLAVYFSPGAGGS